MTEPKKEVSPKIVTGDTEIDKTKEIERSKTPKNKVNTANVTKVGDVPVQTAVKMDNDVFVSHKKVLKAPMTRAAYNIYRGWQLPEDENGADDGYLVEYIDGGEPNDVRHAGYISWTPKKQFDDGYTVVSETKKDKTLDNSTVEQAKASTSDLEVFGNGDMFKLLCKASSKSEGWMKSTKAMFTGTGCVIQVTTQQYDNVSESVTFVPGVKIKDILKDASVVARSLVKI